LDKLGAVGGSNVVSGNVENTCQQNVVGSQDLRPKPVATSQAQQPWSPKYANETVQPNTVNDLNIRPVSILFFLFYSS